MGMVQGTGLKVCLSCSGILPKGIFGKCLCCGMSALFSGQVQHDAGRDRACQVACASVESKVFAPGPPMEGGLFTEEELWLLRKPVWRSSCAGVQCCVQALIRVVKAAPGDVRGGVEA